jgi:hypothetical protein
MSAFKWQIVNCVLLSRFKVNSHSKAALFIYTLYTPGKYLHLLSIIIFLIISL